MNEDQNFSKRNALNAEKAQLMSSLAANTSPIGDWKVMKIYEARMRGEADPYDFEALATQRQEVRNRLNVISIELAKLDGTEPTPAQLLALAKAEKQTAITEHDNSANVNSFTVGGIPMWLNFDQRSRLKATLDAIEGEGGTEMTKSFGGIDYTFTCVQWRSMINAVEVYAGQCQTVTQEHRNAIDVLTTIEKVQQYDFTTGYPQKLSF
jgi:hypothetical protein